jgi:hypothetical protein
MDQEGHSDATAVPEEGLVPSRVRRDVGSYWGVNSRGDGWSILDQLISRRSAARWRSVILGGSETCKLWPCDFSFSFCDCDQRRLVLRIWCYSDIA